MTAPAPQPNGAAALAVSNLTKAFGGDLAVDDVSFTIAPGELLALIGPNGAGKTTCFNMLNGQLRPDRGRILLGGRDVTGLAPRKIWRLGVGRTFQITATFPSMTVVENVQIALMSDHKETFGLVSRATRRRRDAAMALLDEVGMADQADRHCAQLAYGDLKRLELAGALAHKPSLLLMDEPTAGMAPADRIGLMAQIEKIVDRDGVSVLFTEHDMDVVFRHAHRILVLDRGRIIAEGSGEEIRGDARVREVYLGGEHDAEAGRTNADA